MSITAIVENDTIKLPMHVPDGTRVRIEVELLTEADLPDICCDGSPWDDSSEGARAWIEWFDALEPVMAPREFEQWESERLAEKERQKVLAAQEADRIATMFP